jgi:hypothetical protein
MKYRGLVAYLLRIKLILTKWGNPKWKENSSINRKWIKIEILKKWNEKKWNETIYLKIWLNKAK